VTRTLQEYKARAQARAAADPSVVPHGTVSGYDYWGCRCNACARTKSARNRELYVQGRKVYGGPVPHGTRNGYSNYKCRCAECRGAWSASRARERARARGGAS
jgi:hypothetical protein